jgi:hypothetical protein
MTGFILMVPLSISSKTTSQKIQTDSPLTPVLRRPVEPAPDQRTSPIRCVRSEKCQQETSLFGNGRAFRLHPPGQKFQHCDTARLSSVAKTSRDPENTTAERSRAIARSDCLHLAALISERASPRGFSIGLRAGGLCRTARPFRLLGRRRSHGDRVVEPRAAYRLDFHWR